MTKANTKRPVNLYRPSSYSKNVNYRRKSRNVEIITFFSSLLLLDGYTRIPTDPTTASNHSTFCTAKNRNTPKKTPKHDCYLFFITIV